MDRRDVLVYGQAEASSADVPASAAIEAVETFEDPIVVFTCDARLEPLTLDVQPIQFCNLRLVLNNQDM
jgi:hypothetical protein